MKNQIFIEYQKEKLVLTPQLAINTIIAHFKITNEDLLSKSRKELIMPAKKAAAYLLYFHFKKKDNHTLETLGELIGYDHTMMLHHFRTCKNLMNTDPAYRNKIEIINESFLCGDFFYPDNPTISTIKKFPELFPDLQNQKSR